MNRHYRLATLALVLLAGLQVLWYAWLAPPTTLPVPAALALSLLLFAAPLFAARSSVHAGLLIGALIALVYFAHGVMEAYANPAVRGLAATEIVLSLTAVLTAGWPAWQQALGKRRRSRGA
ncbi:MAG: DUF2069 domain-containing protein [Lysobacterales bacterium]